MAHRRVYHSTVGMRVIKKKKELTSQPPRLAAELLQVFLQYLSRNHLSLPPRHGGDIPFTPDARANATFLLLFLYYSQAQS